jgi:hypothetical protein
MTGSIARKEILYEMQVYFSHDITDHFDYGNSGSRFDR